MRIDAQAHGYRSHLWGTYRQWAAEGGQVRKAAKASYVVFVKQLDVAAEDPGTGEAVTTRGAAGRTRRSSSRWVMDVSEPYRDGRWRSYL